MTKEDLGYNQIFEEKRKELGLMDFSVARVTFESKGAYKIKNEKGEYLAKVTGKQIFEASSREDFPAVGDWVAITELEAGEAVIKGILPRQSIIKRKHGDKNRIGEKSETQVIATNVDVAFVVESGDRDFSLNRFERYFAILESGGVRPAIILNKIDLLSEEELEERSNQLKNRFPDIDIILTSVVKEEGLSELKNYIAPSQTYCFLGSSGVGKSSLINKLLDEEAIKTGDISSFSGRGKHTTTSRQMYFLENGGIVIDNPGVREVGLADVGQGVDNFFEEINSLGEGCKYADCTHIHEPGCAVREAVKAGELDEGKYSNYLSLKKEVEYSEMNEVEKRQKDRQFGKMVKRVKKDLKDFGF